MFYDFIISGGGLSGALIANILQGLGYSIFIFDKSPGLKEDLRTSAISYASKVFLEEFDLWQDIEEFTPIKEIYSYEYNSASFLHFDHSKKSIEGKKGMSYVVPNTELQRILYNGKINIHYNLSYKKLYYSQEKIKLILENNQVIEGRFLIAAEGRDSAILKLLKLAEFNFSYKQASIICNLRAQVSHKNIAREIFTPNGMVALLPLQAQNEYSLIWTVNFEFAQNIVALEEYSFLEEITKYSQIEFSAIIGQRISYPLSLHFVPKCYSKNIILLGDTIHAIHPVAGQGLNLTIADVYHLAKIIEKEKLISSSKVNGLSNLKEKLAIFSRNRLFDNLGMAFFTDFLVRSFNSSNPLVKIGRNLTLDIINNNKRIKDFFIKRATGLHNIK